MANLPKNHPVRVLLDTAATGRTLTASDIQVLNAADSGLPPEESLSTYSAAIQRAARHVAELGATGARRDALKASEEAWSKIADRMTPEQLAVTSSERPGDTTVEDAVARAFSY